MKFQLINPLCESDWDRAVLSDRGCSFFHSAAWAKVLVDAYGYRPAYFRFQRDDGSTAMLPLMEVDSLLTRKRGVSLPFTDECGLLGEDRLPTRELMEELSAYGRSRGWRYFELRGGHRGRGIPAFARFYAHRLDLTVGEEGLWKGLKSEVRTAIRRGTAHGVRMEVCHSFEAVRDYYGLHCATRKKHGVPPQPFLFFRSLFESVIRRDLGCVILARLDGAPVAGGIFLHFGKRAIYKFGASRPEALALRGNNLVMWRAIRLYAERGFELFDFGRTAPADAGLRRYKLGWGAEEEPIEYFRFDLRRRDFATEEQAQRVVVRRIFSRLPLPMLRLIGRVLYPHCA